MNAADMDPENTCSDCGRVKEDCDCEEFISVEEMHAILTSLLEPITHDEKEAHVEFAAYLFSFSERQCEGRVPSAPPLEQWGSFDPIAYRRALDLDDEEGMKRQQRIGLSAIMNAREWELVWSPAPLGLEFPYRLRDGKSPLELVRELSEATTAASVQEYLDKRVAGAVSSYEETWWRAVRDSALMQMRLENSN